MAKKSESTKGMTELTREIKEKSFHNLYLLTGSEHYLINQFRDQLISVLVPEDDTMNFSHYDTSSADGKAIANDIVTLPFFAEHRVILVEDSGFFLKANEDLLEGLEKMADENILIFCEHDMEKQGQLTKAVDKRGKLYKLFDEKNAVYTFDTMDERTLLTWLKKKITDEGLNVEDQAIYRLYEVAGPDMTNLSNEVEKLICYSLEKDKITADTVDEISISKTEDKVFEMVDAISKHDKKTAILLYNDLMILREAPMKILTLITRHYNILSQLSLMDNEKYDHTRMSKVAGINPYFIKKYMTIVKQYKYKDLLKAVTLCQDTDYAIKTGALSDKDALEKLIISLV